MWRLLARARLALAVLLGVRLGLSPFAASVGQPAALWHPRGTGLLFVVPPPVTLVVGLQVLGVAAAVLHVWWRRLAPLAVAWGCLLLLAGIRTSLGKILHNDVLLLLASAPLLLAGPIPAEEPEPHHGADPSEEPERSWSAGPPPRRSPTAADGLLTRSKRARAGAPGNEARTGLDAAAAIVILSYVSAAWWKLLRSGPAWVLSDNMRWSLAAGRGGSHWPDLTTWLVHHPVACMALAAGILGLELSAPLLWLRPRLALCFVVAAAVMHAGTWLVLGLDYWAHLAAVAVVLLPWARMRRR